MFSRSSLIFIALGALKAHGADAPDWLSSKTRLTFKNGAFKVISFSDMHFGERNGDGTWADWGEVADSKTQGVHSSILDNESPDYVVFNGDIITGENVFAENATAYIDKCVAPTVQRNIPFSSTQGNHDNAEHITHQVEIEYEQEHYAELSYTRMDVGPKPWGVGNYWVPVFPDDAEDSKPALIMWFFDSRSFVSGSGNGPGPVPDGAGESWVDEDTVPAYIDEQVSLIGDLWGDVPPSVTFVHIPIQKAIAMASLPSEGNHDDEPPAVQGYDSDNKYTELDLPFFDALVRIDGGKGKMLAMVSGHDHGESWCARSKDSSGIPLCFDGHSGYGGYVTDHSKVRNGRAFNFKLDALSADTPSVDTWLTYEDKTNDAQVTLGPNFQTENLRRRSLRWSR
ncbi:Metallo-dependent phosphatase [Cylindrobasidium torrendii FP15055 ss-10]|uniref:Metallo-dependent phosphatase n=1 Tax=Cylindrobasidium torrendii FP15055 ss-10 TaxID=1314674 RepID=A0A0D7BSX7_9AGAR|nr:Metallo-dependent phosphatase [Cylindrobasidium torrendii FP15055 ss-10]